MRSRLWFDGVQVYGCRQRVRGKHFYLKSFFYIYIYPLSPVASRTEFNNSSSNGRWTEMCVRDYWLFNGRLRVAPLSCALGSARFLMFHQYEPKVQESPQG